MLVTFKEGLARFAALLEREELGTIVPNQCEITYINHIPVGDGEGDFQALARVLVGFKDQLALRDLAAPQDARCLMRYVLSESGEPFARLIVSAEPARRLDGSPVIQLSLLVRGKPVSADVDGAERFLALGRHRIVHAFARLTTPEMHAQWGRKK
jgi:hypothetical protein